MNDIGLQIRDYKIVMLTKSAQKKHVCTMVFIANRMCCCYTRVLYCYVDVGIFKM